jgi:hypothetical protein
LVWGTKGRRFESGRPDDMSQREVTLGQVLGWMVALAGGVAALYWASMLFFADDEQRAAIFAAGGVALVVWAANHLTDRHHTPR